MNEPENQQLRIIRKYQYCDYEDEYVSTSKVWACKSCNNVMCDECFQNRRIHDCILDQED